MIPDMDSYKMLRRRAFIVQPPLWRDHKVFLHILLESKSKKFLSLGHQVSTALMDLGMLDSRDLEVSEADMTLGYPSGLDS